MDDSESGSRLLTIKIYKLRDILEEMIALNTINSSSTFKLNFYIFAAVSSSSYKINYRLKIYDYYRAVSWKSVAEDIYIYDYDLSNTL